MSGQPFQADKREDGMMIRVLVVDDCEPLRQLIAYALSAQPGVKVVGEAADGKAAIERVRKTRPDLVIMDVNMPEMNGIEAARAIRSEFPGVQIVALSANAEDELAAEMLAAGAQQCLDKDSALGGALQAIVEKAVADRRRAVPPEEPHRDAAHA